MDLILPQPFIAVGSLLYVRPPLRRATSMGKTDLQKVKSLQAETNNNTPTPDLVAEICFGNKK